MTTGPHIPDRRFHRRTWFGVLMAVVFSGALHGSPAGADQRFYRDDPISREPETQDASGVKPWKIGLMFELAYNLFVTSGYQPSNTRARNLNTIDEVPDSSWFTNRIGSREISTAEVERGPNVGRP